MADKKQFKKSSTLVTPTLTAIWPRLGTPATGGEFDGDYGTYSCQLRLDKSKAEHADFIAKVEAAQQAALQEVADFNGDSVDDLNYSPIIKPEKRKNEDGSKSPTGFYVLGFRQNIGKSKKGGGLYKTSVAVVDCSNPPQLLPKEVKDEIYGGSKLRFSFSITPFLIGEDVKFSKKDIAFQLVEKAASREEQMALIAFEGSDDGYSLADDDIDDVSQDTDELNAEATPNDEPNNDF